MITLFEENTCLVYTEINNLRKLRGIWQLLVSRYIGDIRFDFSTDTT